MQKRRVRHEGFGTGGSARTVLHEGSRTKGSARTVPYNKDMPPAGLIRSRIFDGLTDAERERWLARASSTTVKRGHVLARQGDPARHFYLVESGFLKVLQLTPEGAEVIV